MNKVLSVRGERSVGDRIAIGKAFWEVVKVLSVCTYYELDGITSKVYPGEEPDLEWEESEVEVVAISEEKLAQLKRAADQRNREKQEARDRERAAALEAAAREVANFQEFLEGNSPPVVRSGYDLPAVLYDSTFNSVNPLRQQDCQAYKAYHVGNGLGWECSGSDLELLFEFILEVSEGLPPHEKVLKRASRNASGDYCAGHQYYRWLLARGYSSPSH